MTAWVVVSEVPLQRGAEQVSHPRQRFGGRRVHYRHYLGQPSRKPQALRQVAPELVDELGGPHDRLWTLLEEERVGHEAARALARLLQAAAEHGEERVRAAPPVAVVRAGDGPADGNTAHLDSGPWRATGGNPWREQARPGARARSWGFPTAVSPDLFHVQPRRRLRES